MPFRAPCVRSGARCAILYPAVAARGHVNQNQTLRTHTHTHTPGRAWNAPRSPPKRVESCTERFERLDRQRAFDLMLAMLSDGTGVHVHLLHYMHTRAMRRAWNIRTHPPFQELLLVMLGRVVS